MRVVHERPKDVVIETWNDRLVARPQAAIVLNHLEPEAMEPLFTTWYGWVVVAVIAVLLLVGGIFIRKIVAIDV